MSKETVKIEKVTPLMAKKYLESNTKNRVIKPLHVKRMAQSMVNGDFLLTNMGIGFDTNGVLTDGQQRLHAVIKANVPVQMLVLRNLNPKARLVVDTGVIRTHSNSLQMSGLGKLILPNGKTKDVSKLLASVSAYIILHQTNRFKMIQAFGNVITNDEIVDFVSDNEAELMDSVKIVLDIVDNCEYVTKAHMFFIYQMHKFFNNGKITDFINIVCGNKNSANPDTCPATKLRNELRKNNAKKFGTKFNTKDLLGLTIDASNKYMKGQEMKANRKLIGRPNGAEILGVQFSGELTDEATKFFNSALLTTETV